LQLQTHGQLPASDLAGRLEVSIRTIMRDVEALSAAGVPVYTVRGPQGGVALLPGYRTDVTGLTADESRSLFVLLAGSAHADLGLGPALGSALRKVMAALPAPHRPDADLTSRRILIDPVRWRGGPGPAQPDLAAFQEAVFTDRRLRLRYRHGRDNRVRTYTVDPYGLVNKAGVWYLVADHNGEPRLFRADRSSTATVLNELARRRDGLELAEVWDGLRRGIEDIPAQLAVTARVRDEVLPMFLRLHAADLAPAGSDAADPSAEPGEAPAWTTVELRFRSGLAAQPLLSFGPDVEVLAPEELRRALAETAEAIAAVYRAGRSAPRDQAVDRSGRADSGPGGPAGPVGP
jgi:predicted DNA-binding transcriptional regulator YafY